MATGWDSQAQEQPISAEKPCGDNLEDVHPLATLDALRLFGMSRSPDQPPASAEKGREGETFKVPDWAEVREWALEGLARSHDLRLLAYFAVASLRTDGWRPFLEAITVASRWMDAYWPDVHPVLDDDAIARRNALNCLADPMAVIDKLRRLPMVEHRQHGRYGLRELELLQGRGQPAQGEPRPEQAAIDAAFAATDLDTLREFHEVATQAVAGLATIGSRMRDAGGADMAPSFESLTQIVVKVNGLLQAHLATRHVVEDAQADDSVAGPAAVAATVMTPGAIGSRQDALRALDAVSEYFRRHEPSSPVPLLIDRARRLVSKDFLEVLADIAPDALPGVRAMGGVKDE